MRIGPRDRPVLAECGHDQFVQAMIVDAARRMQPLKRLQDGPQSPGREAVAPRRLAGSSNDLRKQYACHG
jgi:hypothetical protein